jgi:hypothetical protein
MRGGGLFVCAPSQIMLIALHLLLVRAAQKDSLRWWEAESLTQAGGFWVARLFLMDTAETARKLALEAACTRFRMAFGEDKHHLHLSPSPGARLPICCVFPAYLVSFWAITT